MEQVNSDFGGKFMELKKTITLLKESKKLEAKKVVKKELLHQILLLRKEERE